MTRKHLRTLPLLEATREGMDRRVLTSAGRRRWRSGRPEEGVQVWRDGARSCSPW